MSDDAAHLDDELDPPAGTDLPPGAALPAGAEPPADPHEMADSIEDEVIAEEGMDMGLDPDLAVFTARDELDEEGEEEP